MPYCKAVPISSLTSVRKATIFWIPSNHDLTRLRVERQPRLFKVATALIISVWQIVCRNQQVNSSLLHPLLHLIGQNCSKTGLVYFLLSWAILRQFSFLVHRKHYWNKPRGPPLSIAFRPFPQNEIVFDLRIPQFRIQWLVLWIHSLAQNARQNSDEASNWQRLPHERAPKKSRTDRQEGSSDMFSGKIWFWFLKPLSCRPQKKAWDINL